MKYLFYAIVYDVAGNTTAVGSSASPGKTITTNIQNVTGISINPSSAQTKNIGENFTITATVSPSDANNKGITWSSSNSGVATVDSSGNVHCVSAGTTTITATASDGSGVQASLELTVRNPVNSISLSQSSITIAKDGFTANITLTIDPSDYSDSNISWTIGNTSIATLSGSGKTKTITSTSTIGDTTLTVTAGGKTTTCAIHVVAFTSQTFNYTGNVQSVDLPIGKYKLEVWGAQGGSSSGNGGTGGYACGIYTVSSVAETLYVCIGQQGSLRSGGYNGGAGTDGNGYGGGGATHIAKRNGVLRNLSSYKDSVIIVAGGGGGDSSQITNNYGNYNNSAGGGSHGADGEHSGGGGGGSQNGTYHNNNLWDNAKNGGFGYGGTGTSRGGGGGGGGYYGGGGGCGETTSCQGGGGSGYIGGVVNGYFYMHTADDMHYTLLNTTTTTNKSSTPTANYTKKGNGAARITIQN